MQLDVELPVYINETDWEVLRQWHVLRPVSEGPRVLTMAKLLYPHGAWQEDSGEHSVCIAAFQMFAFNTAFEHSTTVFCYHCSIVDTVWFFWREAISGTAGMKCNHKSLLHTGFLSFFYKSAISCLFLRAI